MQTLRDFEIDVIRTKCRSVLSPEQLDSLAALTAPARYEYTGCGYYLTVAHPLLPSKKQTLSEPMIVGTSLDVECGFVVFLRNHELVLECHTWDEQELPAGFRDQSVVIRVSKGTFTGPQMRKTSTLSLRDGWLFAAGVLASIGALLHVAVPFGGPAWYAFLGAPPGLVAMAESGSLRPMLTCFAIAAVLVVFGVYAFSGLGLVRRLPLLRLGLAAIGIALVVRGLAFVPLVLWNPRVLGGLCGRCDGVNAFLLVTSALCLFAGIGYAMGAARPRVQLSA